MNTYDSVDGGAGTNTLSINETNAVTALTGTFANLQKAAITTTGAVGVGAISTVNASAAVTTLSENAGVTTGNVVLQVGSLQVTATTGSAANISAAVTSALQALGYTVVASGATSSQVTVAAATGVVTVTGKADGSSLPSISVVSGAAAQLPAIAVTAGVAAVTAVDAAALSLSGITGLTSATVAAGTTAYVSAAKTTDLTVTAGSVASVTGGQNDTVTGKGGVTVKSATGAITITEKSSGAVTVEGGTTVAITKAGSALSSTTGQPSGSAYAGNVTVGADSSYSNTSVSADGYPQLDANVKKQPTGDITIKNYTNYTDTTGAAARVYGSGTADVFANGAANVSVATAGAITVKDVQVNTRVLVNGTSGVKGTQTLSSVTIDGAGTTAAITSDALTTLKVINTGASAAVTVNNAKSGGHALALTLGNNASGTAVTDDTATSVTVTTEAQSISSTASKAYVDLNAAVATSLTFNNAASVALTTAATALNGATKVTSITATGAGALALGTITDATKLTSIDASAAAGALSVTIGATGNYGMTVKGGAGADTVTLDGAIAAGSYNGATVSTTVSLGAGNDTVLKGTSGSIGTGALVDGGDGNDTIAASLLNASNSASIVNFETIGLDLTTGTYDTDLLVGATGLAAQALGATYTNVNTPQSITYGKDLGGSAGAITLTFGTAEATGTTDSYAVTLAGKAGASATAVSQDSLRAQTLSIENIETVSVNSTGTGYIANSINVQDTKARTVTISGDKDLTITFGDGSASSATFGTAAASSTDANGVSVIDGSAATGKLSIDTTDIGVAYAGLSVKGGANDDTIVLAQTATVDAGAGNDSITTAAATNSVLTLGAGKDTVIATSTVYSTGYVTTITDIAVGDKIDFLAASTSGTAAAIGAKVTLGSTVTTLAAALDAAANSGGTSGAEINWFQYGGNTYVVFDAAASATANLSTSDVVVKLAGLVDLSTSTFNATQGLLTVA